MLEFTINRSVLLTALRTALKTVAVKTTIPILTGIKLELSDQGLKLTSSKVKTSLEIFLNETNAKNEIKIIETGKIVLEGRFLTNIIASLPEKNVTIKVLENDQVQIVSGKADFLLNGQNADNYPLLARVENENPLKIKFSLLNQLIEETVFAISTRETQKLLTGVHLKLIENRYLIAAATDAHRLSRRIIELPELFENFSLTIAGANLKELPTIFANDDELEVNLSKNQIMFESAGIKFYSSLIEGNYPDIDQLIITETNTILNVQMNNFYPVIERAALISHEGNNVVTLTITPDQVTISSVSAEAGQIIEELDVEKVSGEPLDISFNPDYLKDALRVFKDQEIEISFDSRVRPFILKNFKDQDDFIQMITPIRTR